MVVFFFRIRETKREWTSREQRLSSRAGLMRGGLWPTSRRRPPNFGRSSDQSYPRSIFIFDASKKTKIWCAEMNLEMRG